MARQTQKKSANPISGPQIKRIHILVHALQLSDDTYRAALDERFGVSTCKDLNISQARSFIIEMEAILRKLEHEDYQKQHNNAEQPAETKPERFSELDNRPGMASAAQLRKIEAMWQDISILPEQDARSRALRHFVLRIAKVSDLRFLDSEAAGKVINALNAMSKRADGKPAKGTRRKKGPETA